jgi:hypothetical protein
MKRIVLTFTARRVVSLPLTFPAFHIDPVRLLLPFSVVRNP